MSEQARIRIESHRLMKPQAQPVPDHVLRIDEHGAVQEAGRKKVRAALVKRVLIHIVIFGAAFVFTAGALVLAILLWVRPDSFAMLVLVGVLASAVFVASFAALRMVTFHVLMPDMPQSEPDPGLEHHLGKSVAYGFVALALAFALTGLIVNLASGFATP